jgi:hypothetical protein
MTVGEERKTALGANRDSLTGLLSAPLPAWIRDEATEGQRVGLKSLQASAGLEESQFLKPQIGACCNAPTATKGRLGDAARTAHIPGRRGATVPTLAWPQ